MKYPNDMRPREAIMAVRAFANSQIDDAAVDAARAWQTDRLFEYLEGRVT